MVALQLTHVCVGLFRETENNHRSVLDMNHNISTNVDSCHEVLCSLREVTSL